MGSNLQGGSVLGTNNSFDWEGKGLCFRSRNFYCIANSKGVPLLDQGPPVRRIIVLTRPTKS